MHHLSGSMQTILMALIKKANHAMKEILLDSLYSPQQQALNHLPSSLYPHTRMADQAKTEAHQHSAPHIHHPPEFSKGGPTVQPDLSVNSLLPRKLEHGVH